MTIKAFIALIAFILLGHSMASAQDMSRIPPAEQEEAARQFKIYRESTDQEAREKAVTALLKMHPTVMMALTPLIERDWQMALTNYRNALTNLSIQTARKKLADPAFVKEVKTLRDRMAQLRASTPSKADLSGEGQESLKRLKQLHTLTLADLKTLNPAFDAMGATARALTRMRAALKLKYSRLQNPLEYTEKDLKNEEATALQEAFWVNSPGLRVLKMNAELIAKKAVPADEGEGVRDLNHLRMLLGLAPCAIDPKLHNASRDHSRDMATMNFFAHESPVAGKRSFGERAKLAGTSAHAENIAVGMSEPAAANHGWFLSPGHHVNMFGNHRRVGLGRHHQHWTQMFGG